MNREVSIEQIRPYVEAQLATILQARIQQADEIHSTYGEFWRAIETVTLAGGKRLRPYLTVIGYGKIDDEIIKVATAQELLHVAMLVHDDIIDKDLVRHGQKNISGLYQDTYADDAKSEAAHFASSAAILAGDALISEAYQLLHSAQFSDTVKQKILLRFGTSIFEVIGGELMDVEATFVKNKTFDPMSIYRYKTASYSLVGPLMSGVYCAESDEATCTLLENFAVAAGIGYQIQDDLLGVYGQESTTGKSTIGDLKEGKRTLLIALHEQMMSPQQAERFANIFGNIEATNEEYELLKQDMIDSGAHAKTVEHAAEYSKQAYEYVAKLSNESQAQNLKKLVDSLQNRRA